MRQLKETVISALQKFVDEFLEIALVDYYLEQGQPIFSRFLSPSDCLTVHPAMCLCFRGSRFEFAVHSMVISFQ